MMEVIAIIGVAITAYGVFVKGRLAAGTSATTIGGTTVSNPMGISTTPVSTAMSGTTQLEVTAAQSAINVAAKAGSAAAAGGSVAVGTSIVTGLETAGIGALAVLAAIGIGNLRKCGTITTIGCTKTVDANSTEEAIAQARLIYQAFLNQQISAQVALAGFAQIASEVKAYLKRNTDYTQASPNPCYSCGNFSQYSPQARQSLGNPPDLATTSAAYQAFCNLKGYSLQYMLESGFPALVSGTAPSAFFVGGSATAAATANASVGAGL